ncbi:hypothetical protein BA192_07955 [Yersinia pseudotuberculosis]|uniref:hypothetical protein n=1 Tax=Yersinia pseudotuberculosis TaxID=633 RepID=UPI000D0B04D6|nr:hypothetical protein [Yersinia pseudotuberculosis]PSH38365.1 hypothetical protein BA192_07955 [Yersinia pseudotuberculosis]
MLSKDNDWNIDTSAGVPILVYKNCSVIESEQAEYILQLINNEVEMAAELLSLREQLAALKALEPFCHVFLHPDGPLFNGIVSDSCAGHAGVIPLFTAAKPA